MKQALWPIPMETSEHVPPGTIYMVPQDVKDAMDIVSIACKGFQSGKIPAIQLWYAHRLAEEVIEKAAHEKRIGAITNIGE